MSHFRLTAGWLPVVFMSCFILVPGVADGQQLGAPRFSVIWESGTQFPAYPYDDWVEASLFIEVDPLGNPVYQSFRTRYQEYMGNNMAHRLTVRHRPAAMLGVYLALQNVDGYTRSTYVGGDAGPDTLKRNISITSFEVGAVFQLINFARGMGVLEYSLAPALFHTSIDVSDGHRDRFAQWEGGLRQSDFDWTKRTWTSWGFSTGASLRVPLGSNLALRGSANFQVVPVPTAQLARQEQEEVWRMVRRKPTFSFGGHSSQYATLRFGVDYVFARYPVRAPFAAQPIPGAVRREGVSAAAERARGLVAEGDTAQAVRVLREHLEEDDEDPSAWRLLALIYAMRAEDDPEVRQEALNALQRALQLSPGDDELLRRFGRVRALTQAAAATPPPTTPPPPLALADVGIRAAESMVALPFTIEGLSPRARYRVQVEVRDAAGQAVLLRRADQPDAEPAAELRILREPPETLPARERVEFQMMRADPGTYSITLQVTDLANEQSVMLAARFVLQ